MYVIGIYLTRDEDEAILPCKALTRRLSNSFLFLLLTVSRFRCSYSRDMHHCATLSRKNVPPSTFFVFMDARNTVLEFSCGFCTTVDPYGHRPMGGCRLSPRAESVQSSMVVVVVLRDHTNVEAFLR